MYEIEWIEIKKSGYSTGYNLWQLQYVNTDVSDKYVTQIKTQYFVSGSYGAVGV